MNTNTSLFKTLTLLLIIMAMVSLVLLMLFASGLHLTPSWVWLGSLSVFVVAIVCLGIWSNESAKGFLINEENRLSLTRLQMTLWFALLLTTIATVAVARYTVTAETLEQANVRATCAEHYANDAEKRDQCGGAVHWLSILIPDVLLLAAGLSVAATVAQTFINSAKRNPGAKNGYLLNQEQNRLVLAYEYEKLALGQRAESALDTRPGLVDIAALRDLGTMIDERGTQFRAFRYRHGHLQANPKPIDAQISDLVSGKEVWNFANLDLAALQTLVITGLLLSLYGLAVWRFLSTPGDLYDPVAATLPSFANGLLTLLTISLAGYSRCSNG